MESLAAVLAGKPERPAHGELTGLLPSLNLTRRTLKHLEAVYLVREQRQNGNQELAYHARPFVLCGLPLRRAPRDQLLYTRWNGRFFLQITGHPQFGLPFGQDRLIPIWVATLALRQKSREVHFGSAAQMLDFFQLPKDGPHYRRLIEGFKRIFAASIFFGTEEHPNRATLIDWERLHFFDRMKLWFKADDKAPERASEKHDNVLTLSEAFYREIDEHRIPVEREVVAALAHAPGALDFYVWIVWRSWTVKAAPARVPLFAENGLKHQLGTTEYSADKRFRQTIIKWIRKIKVFWPQCPVSISNDGQLLIVNSSVRSPAIRSAGQRAGHYA